MAAIKRHLRFVLRRESLDSPYKWTLVRAFALIINGRPWNRFQFFAYREGRVSKSFDAVTGVCIAVGNSIPRVRLNTVRVLNRTNPDKLQEELNRLLVLANPGPKPELSK